MSNAMLSSLPTTYSSTFFEQRVFVLCIKVWFDVHDRLPSLTRFDVPDYPEDPKTDEEKDIKAKYGKVSRSG